MHAKTQRHAGTCRPLLVMFVLLFSGIGAAIAPPVAGQEENAYVVIANHLCPLDFDAYAATPDELRENCPLADTFSPLTFTVDYGNGTVETHETKQALIMLSGMPIGETVTLAEVLPAGLGEPVVFCSAKGPTATVTMEPTIMPLLNGNAIEVVPQAGTVSCFWFNVIGAAAAESGQEPDAADDAAATPETGATIDVEVYGCPAGFDPASTIDQFTDGCTGHPVSLLAAGDFDEYYEADTTSGMAGDNGPGFGGIPATGITLSYLRPQSATSLAVFCADASDPETWDVMGVTSWGTVDRAMTGDESLSCRWFTDGGDVDGDDSGNTVEIRAWACVPGTVSGEDGWSYYYDQCEEADTTTTFSLVGDAGDQPVTVAGDWSTWTGVGSSFTIQAAVPDGSGDAVIVCGAYEGSRVSIDWPVAMAGAFDAGFDAGSGQIMTCDWFTLPA